MDKLYKHIKAMKIALEIQVAIKEMTPECYSSIILGLDGMKSLVDDIHMNKKLFLDNLLLKITCLHDWVVHKETHIWDTVARDHLRHCRQTLICKKCGKIKRIKL